MEFDGRELPPYAEPISAAELEEGSVYFAVNYADDEMLIPTMETLVFVGKNLEPDDGGEAYFQDVGSYRERVPYGWDADDGKATFYSGPENELNHIFNYEHALEELMRCSLRRKQQRMQIDGKQ
jgi:hypothetical protein